MDFEVIDFDQICRTCRSVAPYMRSIFEGYQNVTESPPINEMLMTCASVQVVAGDGLPSQICRICVEQLNNAFIFKHQCEKSDSSLREYAKSMKVNEIKEELQSSDFIESLCAINNLMNEQQPFSKETPLDGVNPLVDPKIEQTFLTALEDFSCHECPNTGNVYKCKHCDKEYTRQNHLQSHKPSRNRKKVYVCKICKKTWKKLGHLKEHLTTHLRKKLFSCKTCNRGFNRLQRLQIHTPKCKGDIVYPCDICNKNFNRKNNLEMHKKTHDNQQPILLTIENLDNIENYYYKMDEDANLIFSDHSNVSDCFEPQVEVSESMDKDKAKEVSNTTQKSNIETSAVVVTNNDNSSSVDEGTNDSIESKIDIKKEVEEEETLIEVKADEDDDSADIVEGFKVYNCKLCNKKFNEAGNLKRHVISHSAVKPFKCTVCTKSFNRSDYLNKHQKLHQRQSDFECDVCQKSFSQTDYLAKHKASKHGIGKKIPAKRKYKKQYQCFECGQMFVRNDYLVVHMRRHRGEKPFKCKYCGKGFPRSTDLTVHERRHTGEKTDLCMICGKGFGRAYSLTVHMRTHTGEKPYQCTYCDAAFAQGGDLKSHLRRHTGEKYDCKLCMKSFRSRRMLSQHKRTIHDESKCSISAEMSVNNEEQLIQSELPESS